MHFGKIAGVSKPVSRLMLGTIWFNTSRPEFSGPLLERLVALGGTALDTAHLYGGGEAEQADGQWITRQGVRAQTVLIIKGVCTDQATPEAVTCELFQSLERLGTDHADLYLMHRDNPDVPVGEFVDCLHEHREAGRIHAFGGSNWTPERLQAAGDYAAARGIAGFAASSPHFSLAQWNQPIWDGCAVRGCWESAAAFRPCKSRWRTCCASRASTHLL